MSRLADHRTGPFAADGATPAGCAPFRAPRLMQQARLGLCALRSGSSLRRCGVFQVALEAPFRCWCPNDAFLRERRVDLVAFGQVIGVHTNFDSHTEMYTSP